MLAGLFGNKRREEIDDDPEQPVLRAVVGFLERHRAKMAAQAAAEAVFEHYVDEGQEAAFDLLRPGKNVVFDPDYFFFAAQVALLVCSRSLENVDEERLANLSLTCLVHAFGWEPEAAFDVVWQSIEAFPYAVGDEPQGEDHDALSERQKTLAGLRGEAMKAANILVAIVRSDPDLLEIDDAFVAPVADRLEMRVE